MPRANPNASFEAGVRHLFRHLDDASALRGNPLVSAFFAQQPGVLGHGERATVLEQIRAAVLLAAQRFCDQSTAPEERERRRRQFAIFHARTTEKKPPSQVAAELGISVRQCYREAVEIHRWIGAFVRNCEPSCRPGAFERLSEFQFRVERAAARIEAGDYDRAKREYEEILVTADVPRKTEVLCRMAELELEVGRFARARALILELRALAAERALPATVAQVLGTRVELLRAKLAWASADFDRAAQLLSLARASARRLGETGHGLGALQAEILIESASRAVDYGEFGAAQNYLEKADKICNGDAALKLNLVDALLAQVNLNVTQMRPGSGVSLRTQVRLANRAQEIAISAGSVKRRLLVEALQVQLQTRPDDAEHEVARVLAIANRFPNRRLVSTVSIELADYILQGRYWRSADGLLNVAFPRRSYHWALAMHLKSAYHLRNGDAVAAYDCERLACDVAERTANSRLRAATLRGLATAAYLLAREEEAADYITTAVPIAERYGSLTSCRKTYQSAALITGEPKYARQAERLRLAVNG